MTAFWDNERTVLTPLILSETGYDCSKLNDEQFIIVALAYENAGLVLVGVEAGDADHTEEFAQFDSSKSLLISAYVGGSFNAFGLDD